MNNDKVRELLEKEKEEAYQKFASSLIPNIKAEFLLGVRLGVLRKLARRIVRGNWREFLRGASDESFEEIMLQGMVIGYADSDPHEIMGYILKFLPKIDNWSVCDSFCSGLKKAREYQEEFWEFLMDCLEEEKEYYTRFVIVMFIFYFMNESYIKNVLSILEITKSESYYVKMASAWAISVAYVEFPECTDTYLKNCDLDSFTYHKALDKICESKRIDAETKKRIRTMKK